MEFVVIIGTPFLMALAVMFFRRFLRAEHQGWVIAGVMAILFVLLMSQYPTITEQSSLSFTLPWIPSLGLELSIYVDGLTMLFGALVLGMSVAVMFYAGYYFSDAFKAGRFFGLLLAFTGSMLALVMAGNLLSLFVAWELTSILSFLLIGFKGEDEKARGGASQALMITGGGGLALFAGLLIIGSATGSMSFADILSSGELLREHPWYAVFTGLIFVGCFSKSAQFPLHFWLPGAMSAPTPASAFLHSATMVKAGIYLLVRFYPVLGETALWTNTLVSFGLLTMLVSAVIGLRQKDLKGILAYTTISQLGAFTALIGLPDSVGLKAAMVGILAHALYKGALFLIAGTIDHATGTRNLDHLGGLRQHMPRLAIVSVIVGVSMAGVPPLFGFIAKETLLEAVIEHPLELAIVIVSAALNVTLALRVVWDVFWDKPKSASQNLIHSIPNLMILAPAVLAVLSILFGIGIAPLITPIVEPAVGKSVKLYLFPPEGINTAFIFSMIVLVLGAVVFLPRRIWLAWQIPNLVSGKQIYGLIIRGVEYLGDNVLRFQSGQIRYYLVIILTVVAIILSTVVSDEVGTLGNLTFEFNGVTDVLKGVLLVITILTTLASILFKKHLLATLSLGLTGYAIGGLFLLEPAPDVALVQFLVETLGTVLILMILAQTSEEERHEAMDHVWNQTNRGLVRDILVSVLIGTLVGIFALAAVSSRPTPDPISRWYLENALPEVGVNDVVAGIITDFRGTDTLIEITVFAMASLGVLTMLARPHPDQLMPLFRRRFRKSTEQTTDTTELYTTLKTNFADPITHLAARITLPLAVLIAISHIFYAGVAPGDGFTAGVIAGLGISIWFIVLGYAEVKTRLRWLQPAPFIGMGLVIAMTNALLPLVFGQDFFSLTKVTGISVADIKLASSVVFEIGIFLTVFGGISAIMEAITHPQEVEPL